MHTGIALHQVDRPLRFDSHAGCIRRHQELPHRALAVRHHQKHRALGARLDAVLHAVEPVAGRRCGVAVRPGVQRRPRPAGLVDRPRRDDLTGDQRFDCVLVVFGCLDQTGEHGADRMQRSRRDGLARELGHQRQVLHTIARNASRRRVPPARAGWSSPSSAARRHQSVSNEVPAACSSRSRLSDASFSRNDWVVEAKSRTSGLRRLRSRA